MSQVLAVVCGLEDLASQRLPHGEEDTPVGKHLSKQEAVQAFPATLVAPLLPGEAGVCQASAPGSGLAHAQLSGELSTLSASR